MKKTRLILLTMLFISNFKQQQAGLYQLGKKLYLWFRPENAGSSGLSETGNHLHFEMWYNGYPVNPFYYLVLE